MNGTYNQLCIHTILIITPVMIKNDYSRMHNMSDMELFELSWYVRDYLFRRYNQEGMEIVADNIPSELISTYLRYRDSDIQHLTELTKVVLERLKKASILVPQEGLKLGMNAVLNRFQCSKCKYVSYLTKLEPMKCFRCGSEDMQEFILKRKSA